MFHWNFFPQSLYRLTTRLLILVGSFYLEQRKFNHKALEYI